MQPRLSALGVKDVSSILTPSLLSLSPSIGLLLTTSPWIVSNLRQLPALHPCSILSKELFHQRSTNSRRYGPVALNNSRSSASYYLKTKDLGAIAGLAISDYAARGELSSRMLDVELKKMGIESNHVDGEWTGVSLERYKKIIRAIADDYHRGSCFGLGLPLLLRVGWGKAESKQCLLDFYLAAEEASQRQIIADAYADIRIPKSKGHTDFLRSQFSTEELTKEHIHSAAKQFMHHYASGSGNGVSSGDIDLHSGEQNIGSSLDVVSASLALERAFKPAIKLGRYAYGDGKDKPDCVEVVIREVFDALIYDVGTHSLNTGKLPPTVSDKVRVFYSNLKDYETLPTKVVLDTSYGSASTADINRAGEEWFNLCSEIEGCDYLSQTSDYRRYELRPKMTNVSRVLGELLANESHWSNFKHLEQFWNSLPETRDGGSGGSSFTVPDQIVTSHRVQYFRAPFSDTEKTIREMGTIKFLEGNHEIEVELEDAHGLASVRHRKADSQRVAWIGEPLYPLFFDNWKGTSSTVQSSHLRHTPLSLLQCVLINDHMIQEVGKSSHQGGPTNSLQVLNALISARWGEERNAFTTNEGGEVSMADGTMHDSVEKGERLKSVKQSLLALKLIGQLHFDSSAKEESDESRNDKKPATGSVAGGNFSSIPNVQLQLILWMLRELHPEAVAEDVAGVLRSLPRDILESPDVKKVLSSKQEGKVITMLLYGIDGSTSISEKLRYAAFHVKKVISQS